MVLGDWERFLVIKNTMPLRAGIRWQADVRRLVEAEEANAYFEAQRRAARSRVRGEKREFYHWAKVAAEIARISPAAEMDFDVVRAIVAEEERRAG